MAISPHHYVGIIEKTDLLIKEAEELLEVSQNDKSPIKPVYSIICNELGEAKGNLESAISGLVVKSPNVDKYKRRLDEINWIIDTFKLLEVAKYGN